MARASRRRVIVRRAVATAAVLGVVAVAAYALAGGGRQHRAAVPARPVRPHRAPARAAERPAAAPVLRLPTALPSRTVDVPILMYHRIDQLTPALPALTRSLTVSPADFASQMAWLHRHGFHAVTQLELFDALEHGTPLPPRPVMITFDDGYRDVLWKAAPVLARLHMPATAYVISGRVSGGDTSFLTWGGLHRLERSGVAIGSHTVHHVELPRLSDAEALAELRSSRRALEHHLRHPVQWFAYPDGAATAHAASLVARAGYVLAVTTAPGVAQQADEPLLLHRYRIQDTTGTAGLAALVGR